MSWLPREHVASRTASFAMPPESIFARIAAPRERDRELQLQVVESKPPYRYVTRIGNTSLPYGGTWTWELTATAQGCDVTITERGFVDNLLFRFLSRYVFGHYGTMDAVLKELGK